MKKHVFLKIIKKKNKQMTINYICDLFSPPDSFLNKKYKKTWIATQ